MTSFRQQYLGGARIRATVSVLHCPSPYCLISHCRTLKRLSTVNYSNCKRLYIGAKRCIFMLTSNKDDTSVGSESKVTNNNNNYKKNGGKSNNLLFRWLWKWGGRWNNNNNNNKKKRRRKHFFFWYIPTQPLPVLKKNKKQNGVSSDRRDASALWQQNNAQIH